MAVTQFTVQSEHMGELRRSYRVERKFNGQRTVADVVRCLVRAHC